MQNKKKHHFIPIAYLKRFTDSQEKLRVFLKDEPDKEPLHIRPENIGYEKYYYSQPMPEGGHDHNTLEDFWSVIEDKWPPLVKRWQKNENTNDALTDMFDFLAAMRVRVPATRDFVELMRAEEVRATAIQLEKSGKLPPLPEVLGDWHKGIRISIDPHQSIHAMPYLIKGFGKVINVMGFEIIRNKTGIPFITSDNPVIVFDPTIPEDYLKPYVLNKSSELAFPITPNLLLRGSVDIKRHFDAYGLTYKDCSRSHDIKRWNRMAARFGYRMIISHNLSNRVIFQKYAALEVLLIDNIMVPNNGVLGSRI